MRNNNNKCSLAFIIWVVASIVTILSLCVAALSLVDKKKKREEKELEEYLEATIE